MERTIVNAQKIVIFKYHIIAHRYLAMLYSSNGLNVAMVMGFIVTVAANTRQHLWDRESQNTQVFSVWMVAKSRHIWSFFCLHQLHLYALNYR